MPITRAWDVQNSDDFEELCEGVKDGIMEVLTGELVPVTVTPGEKVAKLKNRRIIDINPSTWANWLKSDRHVIGTGDDAVEKVHCYMVGYGGISSVNDDNTTGGKVFQVRFLIDSYYEDDSPATDADNAEKRHGAEVHRICYAIWMSRVLKRPGLVKKIVEFNERRGFAKMGDSITRESLAELTVDLNSVPNVRLV